MRHIPATGLALTAVAFAFFAAPASAQLGGGLDSFSLTPDTQQAPSGPQSVDKIVAVVNNDVILESELDSAVARIRQHAGRRIDQVPRNVLRSQVLDQLIMRRLQVQRANEDHVKVSKADLNKGLTQIAQKNGMNMQQFTQAVAGSGMSMGDIRNHVRQEIKISKVRQQEVMGKVTVSDEDVNRYLQNQSLRFSRKHQYDLRQILVKLPDDADSTTVGVARERLKTLRGRITAGTVNFAAAARANSQGAHANEGGDLGWVGGNDLPDAFGNVLPGLRSGDTSPVFRGDQGLYLIKLEGERGGNATQQAGDDSKKVMVHEVKARHITLKPNAIRGAQRTRKLARQIRERLAAGDNFAALARKYSDDKATAHQGGLIGWVSQDRLPPDTRNQIESLKDGQVSSIFQTHGGYEIIKITGRRERDETDQAKRNKAREALGRQRAGEQGQLWLRKLRDEAYVDIRMPHYQPSPGS